MDYSPHIIIVTFALTFTFVLTKFVNTYFARRRLKFLNMIPKYALDNNLQINSDLQEVTQDELQELAKIMNLKRYSRISAFKYSAITKSQKQIDIYIIEVILSRLSPDFLLVSSQQEFNTETQTLEIQRGSITKFAEYNNKFYVYSIIPNIEKTIPENLKVISNL